MKKTFIFGLLAASLGFTACSDENEILIETPQDGMELRATVEQPATRGKIIINSTHWDFSFWNDSEIIKVNNNLINDYYTFTGGANTPFKSSDAKITKSPATW